LIALTTEDIDSIDAAGAAGAKQLASKRIIRRVALVALGGAIALGVCAYLGIEVL
jgi:hypothetical protein